MTGYPKPETDIQKPETDIQKQKTDIQSDAKCAEMRTALGFGSPLLLLICGAHGVHHPGSSVGVCAFFRYLSRRKTRHRVACVELHDHQTLELDLYLEVRQRHSRLHWRSVARRTCQLRHASIICTHAIVWVVSPRDRSRRTGRCGVNTRSSAPSSKQPNSMSDSCSHARPGGQGSDLEMCVYHGIWPGRRCTRSPAPRPSS